MVKLVTFKGGKCICSIILFFNHENSEEKGKPEHKMQKQQILKTCSFWQLHLHLAFFRLASISLASSQMLQHINSLEINSHFT